MVALCAVSSQSNQTFELMKDTIKSIVDKYGTSKIHYNVVIYGTLAIPTLDFSDKTLTKEDVKNYIDLLPKPRGKLYYDGDDDDNDDEDDNDDNDDDNGDNDDVDDDDNDGGDDDDDDEDEDDDDDDDDDDDGNDDDDANFQGHPTRNV